jgi:hypothetical protein
MNRLLVGGCALCWMLTGTGVASAAWDNVFQPTLFGHHRQQTSYYVTPVVAQASPCCQPVVAAASPCCQPQPAPCQQCTTQYTQRCFDIPVTTYQQKTYYEPVTTMQTSYYYAPVTSYRYSSYYDPCTCCYRQVATPVQSYELRAQSCPVQSWVQRCCTVPVTVMQKSCYLYPQTTCCTTTQGAPIPVGAPAIAAPAATVAPPVVTPVPADPGTIEQKKFYNPPPVIKEVPNGMSWQPIKTPQVPAVVPAVRPTQPAVKIDRLAVGPDSRVEGQVVRSDNSPRANAQVLFFRADRQGQPMTVTANTAGRFYTNLSSGSWLVYLTNADGSQAYHSRIDITGDPPPQIILTSR